MNFSTLLYSLENNILTLTINRPEKLNAINATVLAELKQALGEIYTNDAIKAVLLTGSGVKAFVAGADIPAFLNYPQNEGVALAEEGQDLFFKIENCPKPFIACVNGYALGGGCELAMACHFRLASENAQFGQPEINLGIIPGYGGTQRLTHLIGKGRAIEWMLTAQSMDANTALQYGLVNRVTTSENLIPMGKALLELIISKPPLAIQGIIQAANTAVLNPDKGYQEEAKLFGKCFASPAAREGIQAFVEKRKPNF